MAHLKGILASRINPKLTKANEKGSEKASGRERGRGYGEENGNCAPVYDKRRRRRRFAPK